MLPMTLVEIAESVSGKIIGEYDLGQTVCAVNLDSRKIMSGSLFIPIIGKNFDGHDFIKSAFENGASAALTSRGEPVEGGICIAVDDTRIAMKKLAMHYRAKFDIPFIAVTGSVGKTTAKDMIASVLSQKMNVLKTNQNLNNDIGLPQMIFNLSPEHEAAVLELGMNHSGEIRYLAEIVRPDLAVITNVGDAHIENLGNRENIFKAKCEVLEYLGVDGAVVVNGDDSFLKTLKDTQRSTVILCGEGENCEVRAENICTGDTVSLDVVLKGDRIRVNVPAAGRHMIYPVLFSCAVALGLGMDANEIIAGVDSFIPSRMRMDVKRLGNNIVVLDDSYNANPQSMTAGLNVLAERDAKKRIAVLGDMLELGEYSEQLHREIGELCKELGIDVVLTQGEKAEIIAQYANGRHCRNKMELAVALQEEVKDGAAILVKASRGMHFEEVVQFLEERYK